jgi:hypothetical protein
MINNRIIKCSIKNIINFTYNLILIIYMKKSIINKILHLEFFLFILFLFIYIFIYNYIFIHL